MTKYIEIKGGSIQATDTDPALYAGAWASGGNMNTARMELAGLGIQTAALAVGGFVPSTTAKNIVESYNGTSWTETGDLNTARGGLGSSQNSPSTAAIVVGGGTNQMVQPDSNEVDNVETWDGSSWTETTEINTARRGLRGAGATNTATVVFGGHIPPHSPVSATDTGITESWNGSSWTETGDLNTGRYVGAGFGTSTAAIMAGGQSNPPGTYQAATEQFDGSSWTEIADISVRTQTAGAGTTTSGVVFGGQPPSGSGEQDVEQWNGSAWTEVASLGTAMQYHAGAGASGTSALSFGGANAGFTAQVATTEEWSYPSAPAAQVGQVWFNTDSNTLKGYAAQGTGAWASGGNLNTARGLSAGGGTQTAAILFGGFTHPPSVGYGETETYDGSSWSEVSDLNNDKYFIAGFGTQTAAIVAGGSPGTTADVESWDGSSWTEVSNLNTASAKRTGFGTSTSGIAAGGNPAADRGQDAESWNGSSWTAITNMNEEHSDAASSGTSSSSGLVTGGEPDPTAHTEIWDGSSWTEVANLNTARYGLSGSGSSTSAIVAGGGGPEGETESWNGSSWTEVADLATAGQRGGEGWNSSTSSIFAGGYSRPPNAITEEWTVPGVTKTLTVS